MAEYALDQLLGFLVNDVSRLMRTRFDSRARDLELTRPQWRVLVFLSTSEGINQSGLADLIEVERMSMARMIDRLEAADLVERRPDANDRRVHLLYLTEKARPLLDEITALANELHDEALDGLSEADRETLRSLLTVIKNNLSPANGSRTALDLLQAQAGGMND
ncbi:MAG: MarR family transcriptional regulator [Alphaproteobacteria bacterium]|nr:MarR family transcriptional regulator [Alphaproteobacteria bacterium]